MAFIPFSLDKDCVQVIQQVLFHLVIVLCGNPAETVGDIFIMQYFIQFAVQRFKWSNDLLHFAEFLNPAFQILLLILHFHIAVSYTHLTASVELLVEAGADVIKESIDDRDARLQYSGGWSPWDEAKHFNGTITWTRNAGETVALDFTGTGFDIIGSCGDHIGNYKLILDGEVIAESVGPDGKQGYGLVTYSASGLEAVSYTHLLLI